MFKIGEFSKMSKTTVKTLRFYDEIGLLKPAGTDNWTGYRYYTTDQLFRLHQIRSLRQTGVSLEDIKLLLQGTPAAAVLSRRRTELKAEIAGLEEQLSRLEFILTAKEEDYFMNYQAIIKEIPDYIVYCHQTVIPSYDAYNQVIPVLGRKVANRYPDLKCVNPGYCFVRYLENEYKEHDIKIEFCEAVDQLKEDFDDIRFRRIPATTVVSVLYKGPYTSPDGGIGQAYAYAFRWIEENGYEMNDSPRESYIDGIWNKDDPANWLTELQFPIRKKAYAR